MGKPVVHFEIGCRDLGRTTDFYRNLFDWEIQPPSGLSAAIDTAAGDEGIQGHFTALGHEPHNYVTVYIEVDDVQEYLDKAVELGAKPLLPVLNVPGQGIFTWIADPDGIVIGLWKTAVPS